MKQLSSPESSVVVRALTADNQGQGTQQCFYDGWDISIAKLFSKKKLISFLNTLILKMHFFDDKMATSATLYLQDHNRDICLTIAEMSVNSVQFDYQKYVFVWSIQKNLVLDFEKVSLIGTTLCRAPWCVSVQRRFQPSPVSNLNSGALLADLTMNELMYSLTLVPASTSTKLFKQK